MKKTIKITGQTALIAFLYFIASISAQAQTAPPAQAGFSYQAVARNQDGVPLKNQSLTIRIAILAENELGETIWQEEHDVTTNPFGLFTLQVGDPEASNQSGSVPSFDQIDWSAMPYFMKIWVSAGGAFTDMGGSPIHTVPMAQYAASAKSANSSFSIQPTADGLPGEALFEVRRRDGQPVFAVYEDMVWVYVDTTETKGVKGGFAVGGYSRTKGITQEYLRVSPDSVRVYIESDAGKGVKGGFAVGGYSRTKGPGDELFLNVSGNSTVDVVEDVSQILWYPKKEAFLAGNIHVGSVDSVGRNSMSMGYKTIAMGDYSQAFGYESMSLGRNSTSFGYRSTASGNESYAFGSTSVASNYRSFALGFGSTASGFSSMALGTFSDATDDYSTAVGYRSEASGRFSHSFGVDATASGERSMALGMGAVATAPRSLAMGDRSHATGDTTISIGSGATASGSQSVALGAGTSASNKLATAIGYNSSANGYKSISLGTQYVRTFFFPIIIIPPIIFLKGDDPEAIEPKAETTSKGSFVSLPPSTTRDNVANGNYSLAIGNGNLAENGGTAVGVFNDALTDFSTAIGFGNQAAAQYSFAGGFANRTDGEFATAFGRYTSAAAMNSFTIGTYNKSVGSPGDWIPTDPLFQIGNGTGPDPADQHDAFRVNKNGSVYIRPQKATHGQYIYGNNNYLNSYNYSRIDSENGNPEVYGFYNRIYSTDNTISDVYSGHFTGYASAGTYHGLYADLRTGDASDVAEYIYDSNGDTEAGDVLVADPEKSESVLKSSVPYQSSVIGVVTTDPHMVMGMELVVDEETGEPLDGVSATRLALTGRVPVKVTEENGPIAPGDLLTSSSTPGHAMKWSLKDVNEAKDFDDLKRILSENEQRRNAVIGKALSSSASGNGTVIVLISVQ